MNCYSTASNNSPKKELVKSSSLAPTKIEEKPRTISENGKDGVKKSTSLTVESTSSTSNRTTEEKLRVIDEVKSEVKEDYKEENKGRIIIDDFHSSLPTKKNVFFM